MKERFYAYIMASKRNGTLYTGSTDDLVQRASVGCIKRSAMHRRFDVASAGRMSEAKSAVS
jgi:predicted GIY-YIG superfamily endonuclease